MNEAVVQMECDAEERDELFEKITVPKELLIEPRPIFLKLGAVNNVKGSAYVEYGKTKVIVIIDPPKENTNQPKNIETLCVISCVTTFLPTSFDVQSHLNHKQDMISISLKKILESSVCRKKFSNVQLDVKVTILEDDGCALSTAINCCCAALVAAGIPTYDIFTASTICYYKGIEFVNPDANTEKLISAMNEKTYDSNDYGIVITTSFPSLNQVTGCFQRGMLSRASFGKLLTHTLQVNERLGQSLKQIFLKHVQKTISTNGSS